MSSRPRPALPPVAPRPDPAPRSDRVNQIIAAARLIVETEGAESLTMRRLGDELLARVVADRAGVSLKTVSRVINDEPGVTEATAECVHRAIEELGFRRNDLARSLRLRVWIGLPDGSASASADGDGDDPEALGLAVAEQALEAGGRPLLEASRA